MPYFSTSLRNSVLAFTGVIPSEKVTQGCICIRYSINNSTDYFLFKENLLCPIKDLKLYLNKSGFRRTHTHTHTKPDTGINILSFQNMQIHCVYLLLLKSLHWKPISKQGTECWQLLKLSDVFSGVIILFFYLYVLWQFSQLKAKNKNKSKKYIKKVKRLFCILKRKQSSLHRTLLKDSVKIPNQNLVLKL